MIAILLNAASGAARRANLRQEIEDLFGEAGATIRIGEIPNPAHIADAARRARADRPDAVVAAGGDGTVSAVASALAGTATPLGVLPLGTLNHFARDARIPTDLRKAVETVARARVRRIDVGRINGRIFINNSSIGVYPDVVQVRERLRERGYPKWLAMLRATADVVSREGVIAIRMEAHRTTVVARTPFVFVGNNEYQIEGVRIGARASLDGGRLFVYYSPPARTRDLPKMFGYSLLRMARRTHRLETLSGTRLWVDTPSPTVTVACDGELLTLRTPLDYRAWPAALSVLTPED